MREGGAASAAQALELIRGGLAALAACDVDGQGSAALGEECADILRAAGELQLQAARRLRRFDALGGPATEHASSLPAWLGRRCRLRPWEATQLATTAARLPLLGDTLAAFERGDVEFGDVATIAEGIDRAADTMTAGWTPERIAATAQPILLETAPRVTPGQLRKVACRIALTLDGQSAERRRRQIERQAFLNLRQGIDGVCVLSAEMGAADLAVLEKAVDAFAPLPAPDRPRWANTPGHRRLRGLINACEIALNAAARNGHREGGGVPLRVHVIASQATVDPAVPATQAPPARTEYGTVLTAAQVREMTQRHRTRITRITIGSDGRVADAFSFDGQPLNWGRTRRFFTAAQREVYLALFAGCAAEGCDRPPAWTDIDHKQAWADGGRTDLDNGQPLCRWHNLHKEHIRRRDENPREKAAPDRPPGEQRASDPPSAKPPPTRTPKEDPPGTETGERPGGDPPPPDG